MKKALLLIAFLVGIAGPLLDVFFVRSKMSRHAVVAVCLRESRPQRRS